MIMDRQLLFSNAQALTASAMSSNVIDLTVARDLGPGDLELAITVVQAFAGGTSVQFAYVTADTSDFASPQVIVQTPAIPVAQLVAGSEWLRVELPSLSRDADRKRYIGVQYTVSGTMTAGAVTAGIVLDRSVPVAYPSGLNLTGF